MDLQQLMEVEVVVTVGTRVEGRTRTDTLAPVDLFFGEELHLTGQGELGKVLQEIAPSFNFSNTTISDGSDIIRPATLRGLGPDQALLLINGKRRHQQALVHVQETVGKGSAGYDLNAIPVSAIERVEILRDGAAAQYGSDAIAGVINIVLKRQTESVFVQGELGQTYEGDGENKTISLNTGFGDEDGWINFTVEKRNRGEVNRAGLATLETTGGFLIGDWRGNEGEPVQRLRIGEAESDNSYVWLNSAKKVSSDIEAYLFGGISSRDGKSFGFFRGPGSERTIPSIYPQGFLPTLLTEVDDNSFTLGLRGGINQQWEFDVSLIQGKSKFNFASENSANVSWFYEPQASGQIFADTPTSANDGTLEFKQRTLNIDFLGDLEVDNWGQPLYVALGAELRTDKYAIKRGDTWSYTYGRNDDPGIEITNIDNGGLAPPGIQGFPGFSPSTEVNENRNSKALFLDIETQLSDKTFIAAAIRWEDYEFAGDNTTGKLSLRQQLTNNLAIRSTVSSGFRAPGVQQIFYGQVQTTLVEGDLQETGTFNNTSKVAEQFDIAPLQEETSKHFSVGMVLQGIENFFLTLDLYRIEIDDRIVLSDSITGFSPEVRQILDENRLGAAQFFTNAVNTRTQGADFVASYNLPMEGAVLSLDAAISVVKTKVEDVSSTSELVPAERLFNEVQIHRLEQGQPSERANLSASYVTPRWKTNLSFHYFGDVSGSGFTGQPRTWSGKWLTDVSVDYKVNDVFTLTLGGNNIFDVKPDEWGEAGEVLSQAGFTYGWETLPFGVSGGYYYARLRAVF